MPEVRVLTPVELALQDRQLAYVLDIHPELESSIGKLVADVSFHSRYWLGITRRYASFSMTEHETADQSDRLEVFHETWGQRYRNLEIAITASKGTLKESHSTRADLQIINASGNGSFLNLMPVAALDAHVQGFLPEQP